MASRGKAPAHSLALAPSPPLPPQAGSGSMSASHLPSCLCAAWVYNVTSLSPPGQPFDTGATVATSDQVPPTIKVPIISGGSWPGTVDCAEWAQQLEAYASTSGEDSGVTRLPAGRWRRQHLLLHPACSSLGIAVLALAKACCTLLADQPAHACPCSLHRLGGPNPLHLGAHPLALQLPPALPCRESQLNTAALSSSGHRCCC